MVLLLGLATMCFTLLGGLFALKKQDKLHLILGFSAGAVIGVAFFDLLPEAFDLAMKTYGVLTVTTSIAGGFLLYMCLNNLFLLHPHEAEHHEHCENRNHNGPLGAASLTVHSFLDGVGIGVAFQVSAAFGAIMAAAVLAHDFADGINTVGIVLKGEGNNRQAFRWLFADALAPLLGVIATRFFTLSEARTGLVLALFCGFFLYIGASDLLPESHHRHPKLITTLMTLLGAALIYLAVHFARH